MLDQDEEERGIVLELHHDPMDDILTLRQQELRKRSLELICAMSNSRVIHGRIRTDLEPELAAVNRELDEINLEQRQRSLQITPGVFGTTCVLI